MPRYTHFKVWLPREPTIPRSQDRSRPSTGPGHEPR
jgi:hypothetical protein